jgi:hypothetical protein
MTNTQNQINSLEELANNKSDNIYYCLPDYNSELLKGIKTIKFTKDIIFTTQLSESIEHVIFDSYFDKEIPNDVLPKNLKSLDLGWYFTHDITNDNLPASTEILKFGYWFNKNLFINKRNLTEIILNGAYKCKVSPELIDITPESYQKQYSMILKNEIPVSSYQSIENKSELSVDELNDKIEIINKMLIDKFENSNFNLDDKEIYLNKNNQIVIYLRYSYWSHNIVVFVGDGNSYYRTLWRHISATKPYQWYTDDNIVGPLNENQLIENLDHCD